MPGTVPATSGLLDRRLILSQSPCMIGLTIRIDFGKEAAIGPGKARLLEAVDASGSIRGAARAMGMSYRRAWMLIQDMEAVMGASVIAAATGGQRGGGASLTMLGRELLKNYRLIEKRAEKAVRSQLRIMQGLTVSKKIARRGGQRSVKARRQLPR